MTLGEVRAFFSAQLEGLGLKEWKDGFNRDNIPANVLDKMFHVEQGNFASGPADNNLHTFAVPVTVRVFFKGYRDPWSTKDAAFNSASDILNAILRPSVRLMQVNELKDVRPVSVQALPLAASNDNSLILELVFTVILNYRFS